jgi:hypothetical protein
MIFAHPREPDAAAFFVLQALRRYVSGGAGPHAVWREFTRRLAPGHGPAMAAFERFVRAAAAGASRTLRHYPPCRWATTADEAALLRLLAAAQRRDRRLAAWHGADVLGAAALPAAIAAAEGFAEALLAGGLVLDSERIEGERAAEGALAAAVCPLA